MHHRARNGEAETAVSNFIFLKASTHHSGGGVAVIKQICTFVNVFIHLQCREPFSLYTWFIFQNLNLAQTGKMFRKRKFQEPFKVFKIKKIRD